MKLSIYSDIHLEFSNFDPPQLDVDVIVLAGDIGKADQGIKWAQGCFQQPVVYIFGNHEFYKGHYPRTLMKCLKGNDSENVFILEKKALVIDGVRFLGCILWTDFRITGNPYNSMQLAEFEMNDYRVIRTGDSYRKLRAQDTLGEHHKSLIWLRAQLADPFEGKTRESHPSYGSSLSTALTKPGLTTEYRSMAAFQVSVPCWITHHAPLRDCLNRERYHPHLDGAYASDLSELIMTYQPELWIHGHTHKKEDFRLGATRIISNPRGYVSASLSEETGFDSSLVVNL